MVENSYVLTEENNEIEYFQYLDIFVTKQMCNLMLVLSDRTLSNGEIADEMEIKASALSNIIQRMKRSAVKLLDIHKREKHMMYSLTPAALAYREQRLVTKSNSSQKVISLRSESEMNLDSCLFALASLRERLKEDFETEFLQMLTFHYEKNGKEEKEDFQNFVKYLEKLIIREQKKDFETVLEAIGSVPLQKKVLQYVNKYIYIRSLCRICANNFKLAYTFVDSYFDSKCKAVGLDVLKRYQDIPVEDVINITESLKEMVESTKGMSGSKEDFIEYWSEYFSSQEQFLYYIAEKIMNLALR